MEPLTLWVAPGSDIIDTVRCTSAQKEYAALPRAEFDALVNRAEEAEASAAARGRLLDEHRAACAWEARAEKAERERDELRERLVNEREQARGDRVVASLAAHDRADKAEALLREARGGIAVHYGPNEVGGLLARIDALLRGTGA